MDDVKIRDGDKIKIGSLDFDIEINSEADVELDSKQMYGTCDSFIRRIRVSSRLDNQRFSATFLHEVMHAITDVWRVGLDEADNARLANGLHQVLDQLGIRFVK